MCVICKTRNIGVMKCIYCEIVSEMFVKITSNRTIKTVYIVKNKKHFQCLSNINFYFQYNVIDESLITFDILYFMIVENYKNETCSF